MGNKSVKNVQILFKYCFTQILQFPSYFNTLDFIAALFLPIIMRQLRPYRRGVTQIVDLNLF